MPRRTWTGGCGTAYYYLERGLVLVLVVTRDGIKISGKFG